MGAGVNQKTLPRGQEHYSLIMPNSNPDLCGLRRPFSDYSSQSCESKCVSSPHRVSPRADWEPEVLT